MKIITPKQNIQLSFDPYFKELSNTLVKMVDKIANLYQIAEFKLELHIGVPRNKSNTGFVLQNKRNHKEFVLVLSSLVSRKEFLLTLIHEFTHIKQFLTKRALGRGGKVFIWEGQEYSYKEIHRASGREWKSFPWEMEAI